MSHNSEKNTQMLMKTLFGGICACCSHARQQQKQQHKHLPVLQRFLYGYQQKRNFLYSRTPSNRQRERILLKNVKTSKNIQKKRMRIDSGGQLHKSEPCDSDQRSASSEGTKRPAAEERKTLETMYKQSGTNLLTQSPEKVKAWLDSFDAVLADCDGVLWVYSNVIEGAVDTINCFKELGKKVFFCTNNSTKSRKGLLEKSQNFGFNICEQEVISSAHSAAAYLKNRNFNKRVYIIGEAGIATELDAVGIAHTDVGPDIMQGSLAEYMSQHFKLENDVGAVIVGFDQHFSFPKMTKAASYLKRPECMLIATNTDECFPMPDLVVPGSGSFVRAIETCAERKAFVIGKPNPSMCEWLIKDGILEPSRTLMIGDRCNTDILLGYNCGFQTMMVATGIHQWSDIEKFKQSDDAEVRKLIPDVFLPKLSDLLPFLQG